MKPLYADPQTERLSKLNHARAKRIELLTEILKAVNRALVINGHIDAGTPLHERIADVVSGRV